MQNGRLGRPFCIGWMHHRSPRPAVGRSEREKSSERQPLPVAGQTRGKVIPIQGDCAGIEESGGFCEVAGQA
jgi:hypothetical protein